MESFLVEEGLANLRASFFEPVPDHKSGSFTSTSKHQAITVHVVELLITLLLEPEDLYIQNLFLKLVLFFLVIEELEQEPFVVAFVVLFLAVFQRMVHESAEDSSFLRVVDCLYHQQRSYLFLTALRLRVEGKLFLGLTLKLPVSC